MWDECINYYRLVLTFFLLWKNILINPIGYLFGSEIRNNHHMNARRSSIHNYENVYSVAWAKCLREIDYFQLRHELLLAINLLLSPTRPNQVFWLRMPCTCKCKRHYLCTNSIAAAFRLWHTVHIVPFSRKFKQFRKMRKEPLPTVCPLRWGISFLNHHKFGIGHEFNFR